jgi:hypothetical protein
MSADLPLNGEPLITLSKAARLLPGHRGGDELSPGTLGRWIMEGAPVPGGGRVKLEGVRLGHRWLTSAAALARFAAALTAAHAAATSDPAPEAVSPVSSPTARRRAADRAAEALKAAGA